MADLIIRGATVYDGRGQPPFTADVEVDGGRITRVGDCSGRTAHRVLDASGLAVAPGFIDMHSHADLTLPGFPAASNSIQQGVTTEVIGNCGFTPAPVSRQHEAELREYLAGWGPKLPWGWSSFGGFLDAIEQTAPAVNTVPLVGHGAVRIAVMGFDDRPPNQEELSTMRALVREALQHGAWGLSSGLVYAPGVYSQSEELIELSREVAAAGALYVSHVRGEADTVPDAVAEAIRIGETAGASVQVSHLKAIGQSNWGKVRSLLDTIEAARKRGVRVHADAYPYLAGCTFLSNLLPPWAHEGGVPALVARLRSDEQRARMRHDLEQGLPGWSNQLAGAGGWSNVMVAQVPSRANRRWEGKTIEAAAREAGQDAFDFYCTLLADENASVTMIIFYMSEGDMLQAVSSPNTVIGSDALGVVDERSRVHPRCYGTFVRFLGTLAREQKLLPLEEAVRKMTALTAQVLGLRDRGMVREGLVADLVVFDPATIGDRATYEEPTLAPSGVELVLVNGEVALEQGHQTSARSGRVLRKGSR
jgi:N-acyl-D-aspartate/D-glutamate deacylase